MLFNHLPAILRASAPVRTHLREAESLDELMQTLGRDFRTGLGLPGFEVTSDETGVTLSTPIPGWAADQLDLRLDGRLLSLKGEKPVPEDAPEGTRSGTRFQRRFELGFDPDASGMTAELELGILTVRVPKAATNDGTRIDVVSK